MTMLGQGRARRGKDGATTLVDGETFNNVQTDYTSDVLDCKKYKKFCLFVDKTVPLLNPTTLEIQVQFSHDNVNWFHYTRGPFGYLAWEDTAGAEEEAIDGDVIARYMRLYVVAVGTDALNTFALTADVQLFSD